jgi:hypothetical protein
MKSKRSQKDNRVASNVGLGITINFNAAVELLCHAPDSEVFVDRGWGDAPLEISIIRDGNGQKPLAFITHETLKQLQAEGLLGPNCLMTYKARKLYPFIGRRGKRL